MKCTFEYAGEEYSCLHNSESNNDPVYIGDEAKCSDGISQSITANLEMKMCNLNDSRNIALITDGANRTRFEFDDEIVSEGFFVRSSNSYSNRMETNGITECKTVQFSKTLDACDGSVTMKTVLNGNVAGNRMLDNTCNGYLERKIWLSTFIRPGPPGPSPRPTPRPTPSPTPGRPTQRDCDPRNAVITEVADPEGKPSGRYVEIFFDNCAGKTINDPIKVVRWPLVGSSPITTDLQGMTVPDDGFIVICAGNGNECDKKRDNVGDNDGRDAVAVVEVQQGKRLDHDIIDIYGVPGQTDGPSNFEEGRAVRNKSPESIDPTMSFDISDWTVYPGTGGSKVGPSGTDPRTWLKPLMITEIVDDIDGKEPIYSDVPRHIEIFVPYYDRFSTEVIDDDLKLVLFHGESSTPDFTTAVTLKDTKIPNNSLVVVCNKAAKDHDDYIVKRGSNSDSLCDIVASDLFDQRGKLFGCDRAAIISGDQNKYSIVDMFGSLGVDCDDVKHEFTAARGVRLTNATFAQPTWDYYNWEITKNPEDGSDAHVWDQPSGPCDPTDAIITEVADPAGTPSGRFVEILFTDCAGRRIKDPINVVRWPRDIVESPISTDLTNMRVPDDGFVVICNGDQDSCDKTYDNVGNNDGHDAVAVVKVQGEEPSDYDIIDAYGERGETSDSTSFEDGRAVRTKNLDKTEGANAPSKEFTATEWEIYPGDGKGKVGPLGTDPRVWMKPIIITEIVDDSDPEAVEMQAESYDYSKVPRFIEINVPYHRYGENKLGDELKLVLFHGEKEVPDFTTAVPLTEIYIPNDDLIVVCNAAAKEEYGYCDILKPDLFDQRGKHFGCDRAAIISGDEDKYSIVDMFGSLGVGCNGVDDVKHEFTAARGVRLTNTTFAQPTWDYYNWEITNSPEESDPHEWDELGPCDPTDAIITEVADPEGTPSGRFVEILFTDCAGRRIKDPINVVRWPRNVVKSPISTDLTNMRVPDDGFIVICATELFPLESACDKTYDNVGNNDGHDAVAVVKVQGEEPSDYDIIDAYGERGETSDSTSFEGGRAYRNKKNPGPINATPDFDEADWTVHPGDDKGKVGPLGTDPRIWMRPIIITEVVDAVDNDDVEIDDYSKVPRYVEIFVPGDDMWGEKIEDNLKLVLYYGANEYPDEDSLVALKGVDIPNDGFIVVCNEAADKVYKNTGFGAKNFCNIVTTKLFDRDPNRNRNENFGCDRVAIIEGTKYKFSIVDMFGYREESCEKSDFTGGRAVRLYNTTSSEPNFNHYNWEIVKDIRTKDADPHEWNEVPLIIFITEVADPFGDKRNRFVELYSPNKRSYAIPDEMDLHLVAGVDPTDDHESEYFMTLSGKTINEDGFLVICVVGSFWDDDQCDLKVAEDLLPSFLNGQVSVAIVETEDHPVSLSDVVDLYGSTRFDYYAKYVDGKASRKVGNTRASGRFDTDDWCIYNFASSFDASQFSPGKWTNDCDDTIELPPTPSINPPSPSPPHYVTPHVNPPHSHPTINPPHPHPAPSPGGTGTPSKGGSSPHPRPHPHPHPASYPDHSHPAPYPDHSHPAPYDSPVGIWPLPYSPPGKGGWFSGPSGPAKNSKAGKTRRRTGTRKVPRGP